MVSRFWMWRRDSFKFLSIIYWWYGAWSVYKCDANHLHWIRNNKNFKIKKNLGQFFCLQPVQLYKKKTNLQMLWFALVGCKCWPKCCVKDHMYIWKVNYKLVPKANRVETGFRSTKILSKIIKNPYVASKTNLVQINRQTAAEKAKQ